MIHNYPNYINKNTFMQRFLSRVDNLDLHKKNIEKSKELLNQLNLNYKHHKIHSVDSYISNRIQEVVLEKQFYREKNLYSVRVYIKLNFAMDDHLKITRIEILNLHQSIYKQSILFQYTENNYISYYFNIENTNNKQSYGINGKIIHDSASFKTVYKTNQDPLFDDTIKSIEVINKVLSFLTPKELYVFIDDLLNNKSYTYHDHLLLQHDIHSDSLLFVQLFKKDIYAIIKHFLSDCE